MTGMHGSVLERWGKKVSIPVNHNDCWEWQGYKNSDGYGTVRVDSGTMKKAHRVSWALFRGGYPPQGVNVLHRCDNPGCVNPDHLFLGNQTDNMRDCASKKRFNSRAGRNNPKAKLTASQVKHIRSSPESSKALAVKYEVSTSTICSIRSRKTWSHVE